jgi:nitroreductase
VLGMANGRKDVSFCKRRGGAMEFQDVVDRRRMIRSYTNDPVDPAVLDRILRNAVRAPSAGFSQGWGFLVLDTPEALDRFWNCWSDDGGASPDRAGEGMAAAPLVILALSCMQVYLERYAEPDKGDLEMDPSTWEAPYWDIDTGMASLLMLQTVVDEGLGACFFGVPIEFWDAVRAEFNIPVEYNHVGAITIGHRRTQDQQSPSLARRRKPLVDVVHGNTW